MGHYRSEMGYDGEDEAEAKRLIERRKKIAAYIEGRIKSDGLAQVLADLVDDPQLFRIHSRLAGI